MSGMNWGLMRSTLTYWLGALSEPVLMVTKAQMRAAAENGAIIWDVRAEDVAEGSRPAGALALGSVAWLLADNLGGNLIPAPIIATRLRDAGIEPGRPVILYAESSAVDALIALRALRSIGVHDAQVCLGDAEPVAMPTAAAFAG